MKQGSRKLIVSLAIVACTTIVALVGCLTGDFASVMIAVGAAFSAANAFEHHAKKSD